MRGFRAIVGAVLVASAAVPASATPAPGAGPRASVPGTSCTVFPSNNVWNMDVSKLPVHRKSGVWKRAMHAGSTNLHPDFGPPKYGIPFDVVTNAHATTGVRFTYASESDPGPYPFGSDTTIEAGSDAHALMVNADTCTLYELYAAQWNGGNPRAGSGAVFALGSNALRRAGWTSADAAGLPIFPGLVRWDEVQAGAIHHAIRFTAACTSRHYLWPARHQAGVADPQCPPMGARFRLKAGFRLPGASKPARVILTALKHYGLILADNGSDWYFQGEVNPHWTYALMDALKRVPAGAFVAVDESACRVGRNSGASAYGRGCRAP